MKKYLKGILALSVLALTCTAVRAEEPITLYVNTAGGAVNEALRKAVWDKFTADTGIKIVDSGPADDAKLKAMVETGNVEWDLAEVNTGGFPRSIDLGLLEKLDLSQLPTKDLLDGSYNEYGVWHSPYSTVLAWDTRLWPLSGKHPTSMMDLWNQKDFPGPRCMYKSSTDTLEVGALHAGIPKDKVYPIDQDAAYRELDKLKPDVSVWWTTGAQSVQALLNQDCVMGMVWNGRPFQMVRQENAPFGVAWDDNILHNSWWVIPKGAKNYKAAMQLLAAMQDPKAQAEYASIVGYASGNKLTDQYLADDVKTFLATAPEHVEKAVKSDDGWWNKNGPAAEQRFNDWLLQ
jgi:putative spermidine/putrescine transport system substrate-binding protein